MSERTPPSGSGESTSEDRSDGATHEAGSDDATVVRSIAVTADDVATALEATRRTSRRVVLRVTPPFSGRMRARIHVPGPGGASDDPKPVTVAPETLVAGVPPYPDPDRTADRLGEVADLSTETHHERHVAAVERWRRTVRESIVDAVDLETPAGPHRVCVKTLG